MNNRWSERKDLELGVDVYHRGDKLTTCRSKDIALGGTYLDATGEGHDLRVDHSVELIFHLFEGGHATKYSLHARVVRIDEEGIGLRFHDFDTMVFRSLQRLLMQNYASIH